MLIQYNQRHYLHNNYSVAVWATTGIAQRRSKNGY
ncbi:hypothetical protein EDC48_10434 [Gibbsiella quercinecans]|nr:hypothetical protein EDC48_10434 [Gibbsiella quercinecans]